MTGNWNQDEMHRSIRSRIHELEHKLSGVRSLEGNRIEVHKEEHDEIIGALYVNYTIDNGSSLRSQESYIEELKALDSEEPPVDKETFDYENMKRGYHREVAEKLKAAGVV